MAVDDRECILSQVELATVAASVEIEQDHTFDTSLEGSTDAESERRRVIDSDGMDGLDQSKDVKDSAGQLGLQKLVLTSMVAAGVQFGWALQLSLLTPYIQMLGIEHEFSSFIWLCGPITGLVVQPCIGLWSDKCESKWGRRRPFICAGVVMIACAVTIIGYAADIGYALGDSHEDCQTFKGRRLRAAGVFILGFWLLDLANNTVQGPARALLADLSGSDQRNAANAIFCLWMAVGNILGFSTGAFGKWHKWFPTLESKACCEACANLKAAFLLAVVFLTVCTVVTLVSAHETPLFLGKKDSIEKKADEGEFDESKRQEDSVRLLFHEQGNGTLHDFAMVSVDLHQQNGSSQTENVVHTHEGVREIVHRQSTDFKGMGNGPGAIVVNLLMSIRKLPPSMQSVLLVMALCWLSWFPFFLFDTDWMGREVYQGDPKGDILKVSSYQRGVQEGALGLLLNSVVLFVSSLFIDPLCRQLGAKNLWALGNFVVFMAMACTAIITASAVKVAYRGDQRIYLHPSWVRVAAIILFTILGFPLAVTYSVPYSLTADLTADADAGQGLAMGILNLAVVIPQTVVALGAGPWDAVFGGGNEPAFGLASVSALLACIIAVKKLPTLSRQGYQRGIMMHMPG